MRSRIQWHHVIASKIPNTVPEQKLDRHRVFRTFKETEVHGFFKATTNFFVVHFLFFLLILYIGKFSEAKMKFINTLFHPRLKENIEENIEKEKAAISEFGLDYQSMNQLVVAALWQMMMWCHRDICYTGAFRQAPWSSLEEHTMSA